MKALSIAASLWLVFAAAAMASQPVALRSQIGMQDGRVTLGDLFDRVIGEEFEAFSDRESTPG